MSLFFTAMPWRCEGHANIHERSSIEKSNRRRKYKFRHESHLSSWVPVACRDAWWSVPLGGVRRFIPLPVFADLGVGSKIHTNGLNFKQTVSQGIHMGKLGYWSRGRAFCQVFSCVLVWCCGPYGSKPLGAESQPSTFVTASFAAWQRCICWLLVCQVACSIVGRKHLHFNLK